MSLTYHYHIIGRAFAHAYPGDLVEEELLKVSQQNPGMIHATKDGVWWIGEKIGKEIYGPVHVVHDVITSVDHALSHRVTEFCNSLPALIANHHQLSPVGIWLIADQR
jgi:hypothetical protein